MASPGILNEHPVAQEEGRGQAKSLSKSEESSEKYRRRMNSFYHRNVKPVVEKHRRDRINSSLEELKNLLPETPEEQVINPRLEKAEILEKTIEQIHQLIQQGAVPKVEEEETQEFAAGFHECISFVCGFINSAGCSLRPDIKYKIIQQIQGTLWPRLAMTSTPVSNVWGNNRTAFHSFSQPFIPCSAFPPPFPPPYPRPYPPPFHQPYPPPFHHPYPPPFHRPYPPPYPPGNRQFLLPCASSAPQMPFPLTQPTSTTTTHVWRPW